MIAASETDSGRLRDRQRSRFRGGVSVVAICLAVTGCGPSRDPNLPPTAPVSGQVIYDGKPLDRGNGTITFHPEGSGNPAVGMIGESGEFSLSTYAADDGAVVGQHSVTIDIPPPLDGSDPADHFSVPGPYTDAETTPLKVTVPEEGIQGLELVVES